MPVSTLRERRAIAGDIKAIVAPVGTSAEDLLHLMNQRGIRHIPLVDQEKRVVDIGLMSQLVKTSELPLTAVIMAGGFGTRLRPMTNDLPKPMLPVGDKPLLELIIGQLRGAGIRQVTITTHYKGEIIADHFGDGRNFGVDIKYIQEGHPLGTAGAIHLVETTDDPILLLNGDVLTRVDFRAMLDFHRDHQADLTVAVKEHVFEIPYGVVSFQGELVTGIIEKPKVKRFINAGIYLIGGQARRLVPAGQPSDMPDLIGTAISKGYRVVGFPVIEYWLDVGKMEDYERAQTDVRNGEV